MDRKYTNQLPDRIKYNNMLYESSRNKPSFILEAEAKSKKDFSPARTVLKVREAKKLREKARGKK